jgi:DNA (cytosine-5)-methyltransferase 3A
MKKESEDIITKYMGVKPIMINSSLFSAQSRRRLYWTNIPFEIPTEDKGIVIKDILEDLPFHEIPNYLNNTWCGKRRGDMVKTIHDDKAHCLTASMWKGQIPTFVKKPIQVGMAENIKGYDIIKRVYHPNGKSPTLTTMQGGHRQPKVAIEKELYRKLTPLECERLQTVPDNYTQGVSNTQRYKMLGNGWTIDVIAHILKGIKDE